MKSSHSSDESFFMLVDDSITDAMLVELAFRDAPAHIREWHCGDGRDAVRYLTGQKEFADRLAHPFPDVILLDLKMPRFDGFDFLHWLRREAPGDLRLLPVIVMSSSALPEDINRAYALGANLYMSKPIDWDAFRGRIRMLGIFWAKHVEFPDILPPDWARDGGNEFPEILSRTPDAAASADIAAFKLPQQPAAASPIRFLLVEDNPTDVLFVESQFIDAPANVSLSHCEDARDAIFRLSGFGPYSDRALYPLPDAILLDLMLPGLDGFKFIEWLRYQSPGDLRMLPVIILATSRAPEHIRLAYSLGANLYMCKPIDWKIFTERIAMLGVFWSCHVEGPKGITFPAG